MGIQIWQVIHQRKCWWNQMYSKTEVLEGKDFLQVGEAQNSPATFHSEENPETAMITV